MKSFQEKFLSAILNDEFDSSLLEMIVPVGTLTPEESVRVYQGDYSARMLEALGQNFEATWVLLGDDDFFSQGKKYIQAYPSSFKNLTSYGHVFDEFLLSQGVETEVVQMASFEKAFWKYFHRSSTSKRILEDIDQVQFDCDYFLSCSDLKLYDLWLNRETPPASLDDYLEQEFLCVFKKESRVEVQKVSETQYRILEMLKDHHSLPKVLALTDDLGIAATENDWAVVLEICLWS